MTSKSIFVSFIIGLTATAAISLAQQPASPATNQPQPPPHSRPAGPPTPPPPAGIPVTPADASSTNSLLKLLLKEKDVATQESSFIQQANQQLSQMEAMKSQSEQQVQAEIEKIKKANGWGEDVTYNRQTNEFEKAKSVNKEGAK